MKHYSVKEVAELLGVSGRSVQRRCKKLKVWRKDNIYQIKTDFIDAWRNELTATNDTPRDKTTKRHDTTPTRRDTFANVAQIDLEIESLKAEIEALKLENAQLKKPMDLKAAIDIITIEAARQGVQHRIYSNEEFEELIGTIALSENQEEQIQYLRNRIEKQDAALISIAKQVEQRNYIEAMDKGYGDKPK